MNNALTSSEIQIVIADDHPIFRRGLRCIIESEPGLKVVAEANDGAAAFSEICRHEPEVAVLDLDMPEKDGFDVARGVQERNLACEIIFLTMHNSESIFNAALDLGVKGYVLKDSSMSEIIDCLKAVVRGRNYVSPQLSTFLVNRANRPAAKGRPGLKDLTPSERRVLKLISDEKTSRQIADELFISVRTVDRHRSNICDKLSLRGTNALVKFAIATNQNSSRFWILDFGFWIGRLLSIISIPARTDNLAVEMFLRLMRATLFLMSYVKFSPLFTYRAFR